VTASIDAGDVADPRSHTIALTALRTDDMQLPGDQTQVLVLETAPEAPVSSNATTVLIRGDNWNATNVGAQQDYENLHVWPIDKVSRGSRFDNPLKLLRSSVL
jgi:hypothetical protein